MIDTYELLTRPSRRNPQRERLTFQHDDGRIESVTGGALITRCEALADRLSTLVAPGDRVLLAYAAGIDFVVGFLASVRAGVVPVPVSYPKPRRTLSRYQGIASDAQARIALTAESMLEVVDPKTLQGVEWYSEQGLLALPGDGTLGDSRANEENAPLFLQYTSGSTSEPKGVMVTSENVAANLAAISTGFQLEQLAPEARVVCSWLPAYHDMGLVGVILSALAHDGHAVMLSPASFLRRPSRWLQAMTDYRATITVAPCFGYDWATQKITDQERETLDLRHLRLAACGAEPVFADVLDAFAQRFGSVGFEGKAFYPCYGLAESTLMVTGTDRGTGSGQGIDERAVHELPGPVTASFGRDGLRAGKASPPEGGEVASLLVSSGVATPETVVRIVDPQTDQPLADQRIGEIRVHGGSVAAGYWRQPELSEPVFRSRVVGDSRSFLRTGDLGFLSDGQLFVTGRIKDLMIIGGQNHYPQDLERSAYEAHPALAGFAGAAFSLPGSTTERLVLVHEVPRDLSDNEHAEILQSIRLQIARIHELSVDELVLIRPGTLPRTSSGKVQRGQCRQQFDAQQLKTVASWHFDGSVDPSIFPDLSHLVARSNAESLLQQRIESALLAWLERFQGGDPTAARADYSFAEQGVDSLMAVELSQQIESWLGVQLSPVAAWSYPTPHSLAQHLTELVTQHKPDDDAAGSGSELEELLAEIEGMDEEAVQHLLRDR